MELDLTARNTKQPAKSITKRTRAATNAILAALMQKAIHASVLVTERTMGTASNPNHGTAMTAADFKEWRARLGLSQLAAARVLGMSKDTTPRYEKGTVKIPRNVALACAALAAGLKPYGKTE